MVRLLPWSKILSVCVGLWLADTPAASWRVGDGEQPWTVRPVSFTFDIGPDFRPDYIWGGGNAVEVVVDDDGDGLIDEDPVEIVDDDGDGLYNEDPSNGIDEDRDGLVDEDGVDPQFDDDGDGLLNEDGLMTGGIIFDKTLREGYRLSPFFRDPPDYGDNDYDGRFNEDPRDGDDNDGDGLVDEDDREPGNLPDSWSLPVFAYDVKQVDRPQLAFFFDSDRRLFAAVDASGKEVVARFERRVCKPADWLRPIRLDSMRNVVRLADDRFLSGEFGRLDPVNLFRGAVRTGESGHGQVVDGDLLTAKGFVQRGGGLGTCLRGLFWIDRVRYYPRPDFPDRSPPNFRVTFGGDSPNDFRRSVARDGSVNLSFVANRFLVPEVVDQRRPVIKDFIIDPPQKVRHINLASQTAEGISWELAEAEAFGHGFALEASYTTEIIDVGTSQPRFRRYFNTEGRSRTFESFLTLDVDRDGHIAKDEQGAWQVAQQFDPEHPGQTVSWGRVRWRGQEEGRGGNLQIRARAGTSLDSRIYYRLVTKGVITPFIDLPLVADWPKTGSRIDAAVYAALNTTRRVALNLLPYNRLDDKDGVVGGWSQWSAPLGYADGLVDEDGRGGVLLALPPLTRYIQFRLEFQSDDDSGVSLDYLEFDFDSPYVDRGIIAEVFPDTISRLGVSSPFLYAMKPHFSEGSNSAFNRIEIAVPSDEARVDSVIVDGMSWLSRHPPENVDPWNWLDTVVVEDVGVYATTAFVDTMTGKVRLGIKTALLHAKNFPRIQDRDLKIYLRSPVFSLLTRFDSWVWNDVRDDGVLQQSVSAGNVLDELPTDGLLVTVLGTERGIRVRSLGPNPFSPNGDGVNDEAVLNVDIFLTSAETEVGLEVYTLGGKCLRRIKKHLPQAGRLEMSWDGLDDAGAHVPPGVYLYMVVNNSDAGLHHRLGTVAVAY